MAQLGTVQTVVVCVSGSAGIQGSCPVGQVQSVTQGYLIAPSEASRFDSTAEPFSSADAAAVFGFSFSVTLGFWLVAKGHGAIISFIKSL